MMKSTDEAPATSVNDPAILAKEAARPWRWSIATFGLILLGPLAAAAYVVTRPEPVQTPVRTMAREDLARDLNRAGRNDEPLLRNLAVQELRDDAGHRLTGERILSTRRGVYSDFEMVVPADGVVWREPYQGNNWRQLRRWFREDDPAMAGDGATLTLPAYLASVEADFDVLPQKGSPREKWFLPMAAGVVGGLGLAAVSRLALGPRQPGLGLGELANVKNPEPTKPDLAAIEAAERAKAAQIDAYMDSVLAGAPQAEAAPTAITNVDDAGAQPPAAAKAPQRQLTQDDDAPRPTAADKEDVDYVDRGFYPTAVRPRKD
jgi:hypothetical protein